MTDRILVLGATGMLGHRLTKLLSSNYETYASIRQPTELLTDLAPKAKLISVVSAADNEGLEHAFRVARPHHVINCIGVVKQLPAGKDPIECITLNALLPHRAAALASQCGAKFIHVSTDCVFSGKRGNYSEGDATDAEDLYGKSKALGEVVGGSALTIRTSIIGRQLSGNYGLVEWFLGCRGQQISGFTHAKFSGLPTPVLAEIIEQILFKHSSLSGLYHVSSDSISKFELLTLLKNSTGMDVSITPDSSLVCDRSLNSERFRQATGIKIPSWPAMIERIFEDGALYEQARQPIVIKR